MVLFVALLFSVKFYLAQKKIAQKIYNAPSVVFLGAGEKAIARVSGRVSKHKDMHYAHHSKGILVAAHHSKVKQLNAKKLVYIFNADRPVKGQIKSYNSHKKNFGSVLAASFGKIRNIRTHDLSSQEGADKLKVLIDDALSS